MNLSFPIRFSLLALQGSCSIAMGQEDFWVQTPVKTGTVSSFTSTQQGTIIAGFADYGGTARSIDEGTSWMFSGPDASVISLASDTAGRIYAADPFQGIFRSTDEGATWTHMWNGPGSNVVVVNSAGTIFSGTYVGVYRSTDHGVTWDSVGGGECPLSGTSPIASMVVDSNDFVFAGNSYTNVFRSTDSGDSWELVGLPIPLSSSGSRTGGSLCTGSEVWALHADAFNCLYAGVAWQSVYVSCDSGIAWYQVALESGGAVRALASNSIGHVFAGTGDGVLRSTDDRDVWVPMNSGLSVLQVMALFTSAPGYLYAGTNGGGIFRSIQPTTSVRGEEQNALPGYVSLYQNYPNPFNPTTTITFDVPVGTWHAMSLQLYDVLGREVATLVNEQLGPGRYTRHWDASGMASGVYFYRLEAGDFVETKKLVLLR